MRTMYESESPDGSDHWPVVFEKIKRMILDHDPPITPDDLKRIIVPTLVIAADDDIVSLEHTVKIYLGIPDVQHAIVPGTSLAHRAPS